MKASQIKALDKFTRLDKKYYRKQANRFERHTNKQLDKLIINSYNKYIK